jgi:hypothetical protein
MLVVAQVKLVYESMVGHHALEDVPASSVPDKPSKKVLVAAIMRLVSLREPLLR